MTSLILQKLNIVDCEAEIEVNYFEWGRGRTKDSPEPDWASASFDQRREIGKRGYSLYDGTPPQPGDLVQPDEIFASVAINSRVMLYDAIRFLRRAAEARPFLSSLPQNADLESASEEELRAAGELVDIFAKEHQIGRGKATKVLHKKRPNFIPIIDSVVGDFLWKNLPHILTQHSSTEAVLKTFRLVLNSRSTTLRQVKLNLAEKGYLLSTVRILDYLIWLGWRDHVDQFGFGRPLVKEWDVSRPDEARKLAETLWEQHPSVS